MKLKVLGSSSDGNCYLLENKQERLLIECGFPYKKIIEFLNFDLKNLLGCLVTHEHKDHCRAVSDLMKNGIDIYMSPGTKAALEIESHRLHEVIPGNQFRLRNFTILPFETEHDVKEPIGFLIHHKAVGKILFATDTYYLRYKFEGLNHILIECNYDEDILEENVMNGIMQKSRADRVIKSHFSISNLKEFLKANDLRAVRNIVLLHLSDDNGDVRFKDEIAAVTGKEVYIATKGLGIDLSFFPSEE